jgi:hypothetical protein
MDTTTDLLSAQQLCAASGLSFRQLDFWCRHGAFGGYLVDRKSGYGRRFERNAIGIARGLMQLQASGR